MITLNDRLKTRISGKDLSAFYPDKQINHSTTSGGSSIFATIEVIVGGVQIRALYNKEEDRDGDVARLEAVLREK